MAGNLEMGSLRSLGDSIEGWTRTHGLTSYRCFGRARSLHSDRALARARSLRNDRAEHVFGCCVATLFELLSDDSRFFHKDFPPQLIRVETLAGGLTISAK
ncbi:hypothetical protein F2Q69_00012436 [Brassica cretica]|uniref:Uncharacterized protein n=1 Tax=Brassica cretica TaxID=69181 RepID=A0A8S9QUI9_BRACR|nr:hypothetical protein F2Q69_00012436 [Brassica cretica]